MQEDKNQQLSKIAQVIQACNQAKYITAYQMSLKMLSSCSKEDQSILYQIIGITQFGKKNYPQARKAFEKALQNCDKFEVKDIMIRLDLVNNWAISTALCSQQEIPSKRVAKEQLKKNCQIVKQPLYYQNLGTICKILKLEEEAAFYTDQQSLWQPYNPEYKKIGQVVFSMLDSRKKVFNLMQYQKDIVNMTLLIADEENMVANAQRIFDDREYKYKKDFLIGLKEQIGAALFKETEKIFIAVEKCRNYYNQLRNKLGKIPIKKAQTFKRIFIADTFGLFAGWLTVADGQSSKINSGDSFHSVVESFKDSFEKIQQKIQKIEEKIVYFNKESQFMKFVEDICSQEHKNKPFEQFRVFSQEVSIWFAIIQPLEDNDQKCIYKNPLFEKSMSRFHIENPDPNIQKLFQNLAWFLKLREIWFKQNYFSTRKFTKITQLISYISPIIDEVSENPAQTNMSIKTFNLLQFLIKKLDVQENCEFENLNVITNNFQHIRQLFKLICQDQKQLKAFKDGITISYGNGKQTKIVQERWKYLKQAFFKKEQFKQIQQQAIFNTITLVLQIFRFPMKDFLNDQKNKQAQILDSTMVKSFQNVDGNCGKISIINEIYQKIDPSIKGKVIRAIKYLF